MKQRILIVGTGFSGMWSALGAARMLEEHDRDDVEVLVMAPQAELLAAVDVTLTAGVDCFPKRRAGFGVALGNLVVSADERDVILADGEHIAADTVVGPVGVRAKSLAEYIPGECDDYGRLYMNADMQYEQEQIY